MRRIMVIFALLAACGGSSEPAGDVTPTTETKPAAEAPKVEEAAPAADVGPDGPADLAVPKIDALPTDAASIAKGEEVFNAKGCSGCHTFGSKLVGPDLVGLTERRTIPWIEKMIRHPDAMTKQDPAAKELFKTLMVQMPNQNVSDEELPTLIAFIQSKTPAK